MKKLFLLLVFTFTGFIFYAQQLLPVQMDTLSCKHELIISGNTEYSASAIYNELANKLIYGGEVTEDMKDRSFDHHKSMNRFGADLSAEIEYRHFAPAKKWGMVLRVGGNNQLGAYYSKDLYGLIFYGNERYKGQTIDLTGTETSGFSYQKFSFGLINKKYKSSIALNLYNIYQYASADIRYGQIYQDENFDYVKVKMDGQFDYTTGNNLSTGYGAGIDMDFRFRNPFMKRDHSFYQFVVKNLGVAVVNHVTRYSMDTLFNFYGYTLDDLFSSDGVLSNNYSFFNAYGIDSSEVNGVVKVLPAMFQLNKMIDDMNPGRFQLFYGVRMYLLPGYLPFVYAGMQAKTWKWMDAGLQFSYGGFSALKAGMYVQFRLLNQLNLGIASENLGGFFLDKGNGQSLIARLRWKI